MTFKEALVLANDSEKLVGTKYRGETIEEILIVPTDKALHDKFFKEYCISSDAKSAILPFMASDVEVVALFKKNYIHQGGIILTTNVYNIFFKDHHNESG